MSKSTLIALAAVVVVVVGVLVWWASRRPDDCRFSGWERTIGVSLDAKVKELEAIQGRVGITDVQVRAFDDLMKDYALKYDAACQDVSAKPPRMTQDQYTCIRANMDRVLDDIRQFVRAVDAAKSLSDASAQKDVILKALDALQAASASKYRSGCASAMSVNPKTLVFSGRVPERSIQITNGGNNDFTFTVDGWPQGFEPRPITARLVRGNTATVSFIRTVLPVPSQRPLSFLVRTNLDDVAEVEIDIDTENAALWNVLGDETVKRAGAVPERVTVADALYTVNTSIPYDSKLSEADRYLLAASVLFQIGRLDEANKALSAAAAKEPSVAKQVSPLIIKGLVANQKNEPSAAIGYFDRATDLLPATDRSIAPAVKLLAGTVMLNQGDQSAAKQQFQLVDLQRLGRSNPALTTFAAKQVCTKATADCSAGLASIMR